MSLAPLIAATLVASSVLAFLAFFLSGRRSEAEEMARRLNQYGGVAAVTTTAPPRVRTGNTLRDLLDTVTSAITPLLSRSSHTGKLADDLQKADLKLKSSESGMLRGKSKRFGSPVFA